MRIGITVDLRHSMFSSGYPNASLSVARIFEALQQEVFLVHKNDGLDWWDDVKDLASNAPKRIHVDTILKEGKPLDLLIELSWFVPPLQRAQVATRCVWYCRKPCMFTDLEAATYISKPEGRNLEGIAAIWVADQFTRPEDIMYLQTLYPGMPIELLPWTWTPDIVEAHRKQLGSPVWFQVYGMVPKDHEWTIHIAEGNQSNTSSCTLPMTIARQSQLTKKMPVSRVMIHNTDMLAQNQFFKENVLKHTAVADLSFNLVGRQRIIDWVHEAHSILLAHSRFLNLKMGNLEAAWVGMPIVHNSSVLRDIGFGLEKLYYPNNKITEATKCLQALFENPATIPYLTDAGALGEVRKKILFQFFPAVKAEPWAHAFNRVMTLSPLPIKVVEVKPPPTPNHSPAVAKTDVPGGSFRILFTDMWDDFNPAHNMFVLAVEEALKKKDVSVVGLSKEDLKAGEIPDLVVFGPFGDAWKSLPVAWPKVHFTGENTDPIKAEGVKLNIGFKLPDISDDTYLRMPLWMFEIDWFGADLVKIQNPVPLPIDACTKATPETLDERKKFCAFVVTNPRNETRNQAFWTLNSYKPVDSAGRLFNNVGDVIYAGLGGGGGERKKHEFLKGYRFCLAYENQAAPGYITEKLLHAKAAGCVPIYWGDPKVGRDFNERGFLNASGCKDPADLIRLVDEVESNPARWKELASVPALSSYSRDLVRRTFAEMAKRFVNFSGRKELTTELPMFIGAKTSAESDEMRKARGGSAPSVVLKEAAPAPIPAPSVAPSAPTQAIPTPLAVTCASRRFWPSLLMWLNTYKTHKESIPDLRARVYVAADVADGSLEMTQEKYKDFAEFVRLPTEVPTGFSDFWEPQHFAWKIWIYNTLTQEEALKGRLILYTDAGSVTLRWPREWLAQAQTSGVCLLEDPRQINRQWCHSTFCERLAVTETEKAAQQVVGGLMVFVAGSEAATRLFAEAYKWAQVRDVIAGEKWSGLGSDGKPTGHRHDQSILSVLSQRQGCPRYPLDRVYCDISARATYQNGQSIYVHRGNYQGHQALLPGIDDAFVINLDRREDRKKAFLEHHPDFRGKIRRLPAYDGKKLQLTPFLTRLFKTNDFFWKKAVMGCALSHLKIWNLLVSEPADIQNYLIMEDDARLAPGWREAWMKAYPHLPEDWDCVYFGGILPPNRPGFANTLERVAPGLARVAPNQLFGQKEPTRYFHFCAYAYVLSRRGAMKILESILDRDGYWTSADHMICNRVDAMNLYVLDPMVAGASQDDDPMYQKAEFNNFSRIDNFDSDLWNNDERFTPEEIQSQLAKGAPLHITGSFTELDAALAGIPPATEPRAQPPTPTSGLPKRPGVRFLALDELNLKTSDLYEGKWLQDLFPTDFVIESVTKDDNLENAESIVAIIIKNPKDYNSGWITQTKWLERIRASLPEGKSFKILHLSDEFGNDPIHFYDWPEVSGVLRFYNRPGLSSKVLVLPLGYHWQFKGGRDAPHLSTPELPFREFLWSFAGTNWMNRKNDMAILQAVQPHWVKWFDDWNAKDQLVEDEYISLLLNSKFVPCPRGQNLETYRFYEALECGAIPVFPKQDGDEAFLAQFEGYLPFLNLGSWEHVGAMILHMSQNPELLEQYRKAVLIGWARFKADLKKKVKALF